MRKGVPLAPGVAVARAYCIDQEPSIRQPQQSGAATPVTEISRFEKARSSAIQDLDTRIARVAQVLDEKQTAIFRTHRSLLSDPVLVRKVEAAIRDRNFDTSTALQQVLEEYRSLFAQIPDEYLRERLTDLRCVVDFIREHLDGPTITSTPVNRDEPVILVVSEILPSHMLMSHQFRLAGIITESGGGLGHAAILARSLGIPAVSGLDGILSEIHTGDLVVLDARDGSVYVDPDREMEASYRQLQHKFTNWHDQLFANRDQEPITSDGIRVKLLANVNNPVDAAFAARVGATGVGLYRTEYLFLTRTGVPDEDEQLAIYREAIEASPQRDVVFRTLDVGADKEVSYLGQRHEPNPSLGWRGIRLLTAHPDFFQAQLRAILRASLLGKVSLLVPMISLIEEVQWVKQMLEEARFTLRRRRVDVTEDLPLGVMLEVPAAAVCIDDLLNEVAFVSIGTNDLIQYLMAADRTNPQVAPLCEPFVPAIWRVLNQIIKSCAERGKPVTVCGEMAGQPLCFLPLFGMGLRQFSMSPALVPSIKELVRRTNSSIAQAVVEHVLRMKTPGEIRDYLTREAEQLWPEMSQLGATGLHGENPNKST